MILPDAITLVLLYRKHQAECTAAGQTTRPAAAIGSCQVWAREASPSGVVTGGDQPSSRSPAASATSEPERRS
jgi:hypothetical protein